MPKKDQVAQVKLEKEDMDRVKKLSQEKGVGVATFIRMIILDFLRSNPQKGKR